MVPLRPCRRHLRTSQVLALLPIRLMACSPMATPEPTSPPAVPTAAVAPIATLNRQATRHAQLTATMKAKISSVSSTLDELDLSADSGELAWYADAPAHLLVQDENFSTHTEIGKDKIGNFVFHSKVAWDSSSRLAECGLLRRPDGNIDTGRSYEFDLLRWQNTPAWEMFFAKYNDIKTYWTRYKVNSGNYDDKLSANPIDLVAQGKQFTCYINGVKKHSGKQPINRWL